MPVYQLPEELIFPPPEEAESNGLLAVGGDLSIKRLLLAYRMGIFPWYTDDDTILWWSPDPRLILELSGLKVSKSLKRTIRRGVYTVTMDKVFGQVIQKCATAKRNQDPGTWLVTDMITAYTRLHMAGFAHSVEVWKGEQLAGGLYGVAMGRSFFGESMFSEKRDTSKVALVYLVSALKGWGFDFIDCQITTAHLLNLGAMEIPRSEFLKRLQRTAELEALRGRWSLPENLELLI